MVRAVSCFLSHVTHGRLHQNNTPKVAEEVVILKFSTQWKYFPKQKKMIIVFKYEEARTHCIRIMLWYIPRIWIIQGNKGH